jgi:hypothetical protein
MDVHGGKGIIMGPNNYLGRSWQGAPIFITEGANILSRNLMIFGQGAIRCHPFVLKEMALAGREDHDQALKEFDGLLINTSVLPWQRRQHPGAEPGLRPPESAGNRLSQATSARSTARPLPSPCSPT